jgi:hypothetical protein
MPPVRPDGLLEEAGRLRESRLGGSSRRPGEARRGGQGDLLRGQGGSARLGRGGAADMVWSWRFEKADGTPASSGDMPKEAFGSQGDAENWLGENWRALLQSGVDQVTLLEETRVEYGPMSLHPED